MKNFLFLLLAISVLTGSTAFADEHIGSAYRLNDETVTCGWNIFDSSYAGDFFLQFSNGATGHATFKCKMKLVAGDGALYQAEGDSGNWPLVFFGHPDA